MNALIAGVLDDVAVSPLEKQPLHLAPAFGAELIAATRAKVTSPA